MDIDLNEIKIRDLFNGYEDRGELGVVAYGGELDVRPPYQREFVYKNEQRDAVINTALKGYPLNVMYWIDRGEGEHPRYECLDGQQRSLSILQYLDHKFGINWRYPETYWDGLTEDEYKFLMKYPLMVYICKGEESEKLEWFKTVNIAGEKLMPQELRNSVYTGPWLSSAKEHFSRRNSVAKQLSENYIKKDPIRQELLEQALKWISEAQNMTIEGYMSKHRNDPDCNELWNYFQKIFAWAKRMFPDYPKEVIFGLDWGKLYNKYGALENEYNATQMKQKTEAMMLDREVLNKKGIVEYLLSGEEKFLNLRQFERADALAKFTEQAGVCPHCKREGKDKVYTFEEMEADHITPWSQGGKTEWDNLQMLCSHHNKVKNNS